MLAVGNSENARTGHCFFFFFAFVVVVVLFVLWCYNNNSLKANTQIRIMGKKHREKRQKYVELLRQVEKDRETYLDKRNRKRQRHDDDEELGSATGSNATPNTAVRPLDEDESHMKKRRVDTSSATMMGDSRVGVTQPAVDESTGTAPSADESASRKKAAKSKRY